MIDTISNILILLNTNMIDLIFICLVTAVWLAAFIGFDLFGLAGLSRDFRRAARSLERLEQPDPDARMRAAEEIFANGDRAGGKPVRHLRQALRDAWSNCLVRTPDGAPPVAIKDVRTVFGTTPVLQLPARRRMADMVPLYLLAMGFIGAGLRLLVVYNDVRVDKTASFNSALSNATPSISALLLVTVFCVFIWFLVDRSFFQTAQQRLSRLQMALTSRLPVLDEAELLRILLDDQRNVSAALSAMGTELPARFRQVLHDDFAPAMFQTYRSSIDEHLTPAIRNMNRTVEVFGEMSVKSQTEGMRLLADRFFKRLEHLFIENLQEFGERAKSLYELQEKNVSMLDVLQSNVHDASLLQQTVNQETQATLLALEESRGHLSESTRLYDETLSKTGEIAAILSGALESDRQMVERLQQEQLSMQTASTGYLDTMSQQNLQLQTQLQTLGSSYMETMGKQILQMQDDLHSAIQSIFSRFTDINATTFESIEERSNAIIEQLTTSSKTLMDTMGDQVTDLGFFTREINAEVSSLNDSLRQTVGQFGEQMHATMDGTFKSFDEGVAGLVERLSYTAETIRDSVEDLPAAVVAMRASLVNASGAKADDA